MHFIQVLHTSLFFSYCSPLALYTVFNVLHNCQFPHRIVDNISRINNRPFSKIIYVIESRLAPSFAASMRQDNTSGESEELLRPEGASRAESHNRRLSDSQLSRDRLALTAALVSFAFITVNLDAHRLERRRLG